jgi:hypothetical protein
VAAALPEVALTPQLKPVPVAKAATMVLAVEVVEQV